MKVKSRLKGEAVIGILATVLTQVVSTQLETCAAQRQNLFFQVSVRAVKDVEATTPFQSYCSSTCAHWEPFCAATLQARTLMMSMTDQSLHLGWTIGCVRVPVPAARDAVFQNGWSSVHTSSKRKESTLVCLEVFATSLIRHEHHPQQDFHAQVLLGPPIKVTFELDALISRIEQYLVQEPPVSSACLTTLRTASEADQTEHRTQLFHSSPCSEERSSLTDLFTSLFDCPVAQRCSTDTTDVVMKRIISQAAWSKQRAQG